MSADEYVICPICHGVSKELAEIEKLYGKIPEKEYIEKRRKYNESKEQPSVPIYREVTLNADGTISLDLGAECTVCHAKWKHQGVVR